MFSSLISNCSQVPLDLQTFLKEKLSPIYCNITKSKIYTLRRFPGSLCNCKNIDIVEQFRGKWQGTELSTTFYLSKVRINSLKFYIQLFKKYIYKLCRINPDNSQEVAFIVFPLKIFVAQSENKHKTNNCNIL